MHLKKAIGDLHPGTENRVNVISLTPSKVSFEFSAEYCMLINWQHCKKKEGIETP
jgi:multisubunit Na+/H+ antiporter MnhE subunit